MLAYDLLAEIIIQPFQNAAWWRKSKKVRDGVTWKKVISS